MLVWLAGHIDRMVTLSVAKPASSDAANRWLAKLSTDCTPGSQNLDTQLQRMLNMDDFDTAQEIRKRRKQIDEIVAEQLVSSTSHSCFSGIRLSFSLIMGVVCLSYM